MSEVKKIYNSNQKKSKEELTEEQKKDELIKKYNIFIWNIKCSAGTGYGNTSLMEHILKGFESYIKKCFEKEKKSPDIIILCIGTTTLCDVIIHICSFVFP